MSSLPLTSQQDQVDQPTVGIGQQQPAFQNLAAMPAPPTHPPVQPLSTDATAPVPNSQPSGVPPTIVLPTADRNLLPQQPVQHAAPPPPPPPTRTFPSSVHELVSNPLLLQIKFERILAERKLEETRERERKQQERQQPPAASTLSELQEWKVKRLEQELAKRELERVPQQQQQPPAPSTVSPQPPPQQPAPTHQPTNLAPEQPPVQQQQNQHDTAPAKNPFVSKFPFVPVTDFSVPAPTSIKEQQQQEEIEQQQQPQQQQEAQDEDILISDEFTEPGIVDHPHEKRRQWRRALAADGSTIFLAVTLTPSDIKGGRMRPPRPWLDGLLGGQYTSFVVHVPDGLAGQSVHVAYQFAVTAYSYCKSEYYIQGTGVKAFFNTMNVQGGDALKLKIVYTHSETVDGSTTTKIECTVVRRANNPHASDVLRAVGYRDAKRTVSAGGSDRPPKPPKAAGRGRPRGSGGSGGLVGGKKRKKGAPHRAATGDFDFDAMYDTEEDDEAAALMAAGGFVGVADRGVAAGVGRRKRQAATQRRYKNGDDFLESEVIDAISFDPSSASDNPNADDDDDIDEDGYGYGYGYGGADDEEYVQNEEAEEEERGTSMEEEEDDEDYKPPEHLFHRHGGGGGGSSSYNSSMDGGGVHKAPQQKKQKKRAPVPVSRFPVPLPASLLLQQQQQQPSVGVPLSLMEFHKQQQKYQQAATAGTAAPSAGPQQPQLPPQVLTPQDLKTTSAVLATAIQAAGLTLKDSIMAKPLLHPNMILATKILVQQKNKEAEEKGVPVFPPHAATFESALRKIIEDEIAKRKNGGGGTTTTTAGGIGTTTVGVSGGVSGGVVPLVSSVPKEGTTIGTVVTTGMAVGIGSGKPPVPPLGISQFLLQRHKQQQQQQQQQPQLPPQQKQRAKRDPRSRPTAAPQPPVQPLERLASTTRAGGGGDGGIASNRNSSVNLDFLADIAAAAVEDYERQDTQHHNNNNNKDIKAVQEEEQEKGTAAHEQNDNKTGDGIAQQQPGGVNSAVVGIAVKQEEQQQQQQQQQQVDPSISIPKTTRPPVYVRGQSKTRNSEGQVTGSVVTFAWEPNTRTSMDINQALSVYEGAAATQGGWNQNFAEIDEYGLKMDENVLEVKLFLRRVDDVEALQRAKTRLLECFL